jgi:hypothetical protein
MDRWLIPIPREKANFPFDVIDVSESASPDEEVVGQMGRVILDHCLGIEFFERAQAILGWAQLDDLSVKAVPGLYNMKSGTFGEVIATYMLETHHAHVVPVKKARYRFTPNQSPQGTDVVAMVFDENGDITRFC